VDIEFERERETQVKIDFSQLDYTDQKDSLQPIKSIIFIF